MYLKTLFKMEHGGYFNTAVDIVETTTQQYPSGVSSGGIGYRHRVSWGENEYHSNNMEDDSGGGVDVDALKWKTPINLAWGPTKLAAIKKRMGVDEVTHKPANDAATYDQMVDLENMYTSLVCTLRDQRDNLLLTNKMLRYRIKVKDNKNNKKGSFRVVLEKVRNTIAYLSCHTRQSGTPGMSSHNQSNFFEHYDFLRYAEESVVRKFSFMCDTRSDSSCATLGGSNTYLGNTTGHVIVSQQRDHQKKGLVCNKSGMYYDPSSKWDEPTHSNRVNFRLTGHDLSESISMRIIISMSTMGKGGAVRYLRTLLRVYDESPPAMDDGAGKTYVVYFTPKKSELETNRSNTLAPNEMNTGDLPIEDHRFIFTVEAVMFSKEKDAIRP
jgi:hypothetical protein